MNKLDWDKTFKLHYFPLWLRHSIKYAQGFTELPIRFGRQYGLGAYELIIGGCRGWSSCMRLRMPFLLDHWGTITHDRREIFVNQPYEWDDEITTKWASEIGCFLTAQLHAPWSAGAKLFLFSENEINLYIKPNHENRVTATRKKRNGRTIPEHICKRAKAF